MTNNQSKVLKMTTCHLLFFSCSLRNFSRLHHYIILMANRTKKEARPFRPNFFNNYSTVIHEASDGNRTRDASLGSLSFTTKLHSHYSLIVA
ncbi:protein of unknown function [Latilactobacillus sakei]|nr:hypothetical protein LSAJ18_190007 [Latilactobacillus sakei]SON68489.1 protein of unknown function [Latilactobacillus sakei]